MARKKKKTEDPKDVNVDLEIEDFEEDLEIDFEEDLDLVEELNLLDTEDLDAELEVKEEIVDKDEERKQLYLSTGIHIGTKLLTGDARRFIYRQTNYGLYVIDLTQTDDRLRIAAKFLSKYVEVMGCKVVNKPSHHTFF